MKAFFANAQWDPRADYVVSERELLLKRASVGSKVWRNPDFFIKETEVPQVGDDEVLVKVKRCGVCGSDTHLYETDADGYIVFSGPVKLPCVLGHEYSGVVEVVGKNVKNFAIGDMVAAESIVWCGKCTPCRSGAFNQCSNVELAGITVDGAFAEFVAVNERQCWSLNSLAERYTSADIFNVGALIEPIGCAYNGLFISAGGFKPGAVVVVYGVGPIGLGAVSLARTAGASCIIAFDTIKNRLDIATQMGADYTYDFGSLVSQGQKPGEIVMELTAGQGADVQVEAAGAAPLTVPEMERSLAVNGKIVYLGRAATRASILLDVLVSGANGIVGARGHSGYGIYPNIIKLLASGRLQVDAMTTAHYSLDNIVSAFAQSKKRTDGKILIDVS